MTALPNPANAAVETENFMTGVALHDEAVKAATSNAASTSLAALFASKPPLVDRVAGLSPRERSLLLAYVPPQHLQNPSGLVFQAQTNVNSAAIGTITRHRDAIQALGTDMARPAALVLRGSLAFDEAFLQVYSQGRLTDAALRGLVIKAGQPDVDWRPSPLFNSARELGGRWQHADVTRLPPNLPPAPPPRRRPASAHP